MFVVFHNGIEMVAVEIANPKDADEVESVIKNYGWKERTNWYGCEFATTKEEAFHEASVLKNLED